MNARKLKGIAVVSIQGGEKLGTVEDVIIDSQTRSIGAFKLQSGGLLHKEHCYVPFTSVHSVGADAIMVQDGDVLQSTFGERPSGYHTLGNLGDVRVVTESGAYLGNVDSIQFDTATGAVTDYEFGTGGIGGVFKGNKAVDASSVTSIGKDIMVVPDALSETGAS